MHCLVVRSWTNSHGSALLVVLWVVALLSFMVITSLLVVRQDVERVGARQQVFRARQLAEMGVAMASHPAIKDTDPLLRQEVSDFESFEAVITTEESRLRVNSLLNDQYRAVLERVFTTWGLTPPEAEALVNSLMDWADPDDFVRLNSAERRQYEAEGILGRPYNQPLRSVEEMALVWGMDRLTAVKPDWGDWVTFHGSGKLDLNEAPAELLAAFLGIPLSRAESFVQQRHGLDGIPHTEDDVRAPTVEEALAGLGVSGGEVEALGPLVTAKGTTTRIESIGRVSDYARAIVVVLQKSGNRPQILLWKETAAP